MLTVRDIWLLDLFLAVVDNGSMAGAARERHLTTPTVSEAIAKLETLVGSVLLIRSSRGCHPTADGRRVVGHARDLLDELETHLGFISSNSGTGYRIGSTFGAQTAFTTAVQQQEPLVDLTPVSLSLADPGRQLLDGSADMALLMGPTRYDHSFHREPITTEKRYAVVDAANVPSHTTEVSLEFLDGLQWPSFPADADDVFLGRWLCADARPGLPPRLGPALGDVFAIRDWALSNRGDMVVPTTWALASMFGGVDGVVALPIAGVEDWQVDLVGPRQVEATIKKIARLMRTSIPSAGFE